MLVVASDRVSAFDHVLEPGHPRQGRAADHAQPVVVRPARRRRRRARHPEPSRADHVLGPTTRRASLIPAEVAGRAMLVQSLEMLPIECVVRGYLTGSGWAEYQRERHGVRHPAARRAAERRPAARADLHAGVQGADGRARREHLVRAHRRARRRRARARELRDLSLEIYARAARDRRGARADPRRHQVRVRPRRRRAS